MSLAAKVPNRLKQTISSKIFRGFVPFDLRIVKSHQVGACAAVPGGQPNDLRAIYGHKQQPVLWSCQEGWLQNVEKYMKISCDGQSFVQWLQVSGRNEMISQWHALKCISDPKSFVLKAARHPTQQLLEQNIPILVGRKNASHIIQHILKESINQQKGSKTNLKGNSKGSQRISLFKRKPTSEQLKWLFCWNGSKIPSWQQDSQN